MGPRDTQTYRPDAEPAVPVEAGPSLAPGDVLGHFGIVERVGKGGMGEVYAARDHDLDRKVAIKVLRQDTFASEERRARLRREAQALAKVIHPNVVTVFEVGEHAGQLFIAMEFVEGQTLHDWLAGRPRSWREIVDCFIQAGQGLLAAHRQSLVHRDFKPENVFVGADGRVRVGDFGVVGVAGSTTGSGAGGGSPLAATLTETGDLLGTPRYMSPEQHGGGPIDPRADQFAFTASLYQALFRRPAFLGKKIAEVRDNVLAGRVQPIPRKSGVPRWLEQAVERGLATDPDRRFPSMDAMLAALARKPLLTRRSAALAVVAAAVVALAVAGVAGRRGDPCGGARERLAGVWDDGVKNAVETAFAGSPRPYAADSFGRAARALDAYATSWVEMRTDACRATSVRNEQSVELLDARVACLDARLEELRLLTRQLAAPGEPGVVDRAIPAVLGLEPVDRCASNRVLGKPAKRTPAAQAAAQRLAESSTLLQVGKVRAVRDGLSALVEQARQAGDSIVLAETLVHAGKVLEEVDPARAAAALDEAVTLAADDDDLQARALLQLIYVMSRYQKRGAEARGLRPAVEAAVQRTRDERQRVTYLQRSAALQFEDGRYDQSVATIDEATALASKVHGVESLVYARLLYDRARSLGALGKHEEARAMLLRGLGIVEKIVGPQHPAVKPYVNLIGGQEYHARNYEAARGYFQRVLELSETVEGPNTPGVAAASNNLALVASAQGDFERAEAYYRRSLALEEARVGGDSPDVADILSNLGNLLLRRHQPAEALTVHRRALAIREKALPPGHPDIGESLNHLAETHAALGKPQEGIPLLVRSKAIMEAAFPPGHQARVMTLITLAKLQVGARHADDALAELAAAEQQLADKPDRLAEAHLHFQTAQALQLARREPARALALMRQARATFADFPAERSMLEAADRFLAGR